MSVYKKRLVILQVGWGQLCWPLLQSLLCCSPSAADWGSTSVIFPSPWNTPGTNKNTATPKQENTSLLLPCHNSEAHFSAGADREYSNCVYNISANGVCLYRRGTSTPGAAGCADKGTEGLMLLLSPHRITSVSNLCKAGSACMTEMMLHKEKDKMQPTYFTVLLFFILFLKFILWTEVVLSVWYPREQQCRGKLPSLANTN